MTLLVIKQQVKIKRYKFHYRRRENVFNTLVDLLKRN